jgi:N-acetylglucosamine kinase-like BadF-type ATPase
MSVTVGIDAGQSQIRIRVSGEQATSVVPGVRHLEHDTDAAVVAAIAHLWGGRPERPSLIVAGLTTLPDTAETRRHLAGRIAHVTGAGEVWICGDEVTAHAGALDGAAGVVLSVGTGVACLALDKVGGAQTFDGAGYLVGDEGGAFWLGRHGIRSALAAVQGRGPTTSLAQAVADLLGPLDELASRLHRSPKAVDSIAQLAPTVLAAAAAGDEVAEAIVSDAAGRLANTACAAVASLGDAGSVALGGRVLAENERFFAAVAALILSRSPSTEVTVAKGSGLDGASRLAESGEPGPYAPLLTRVGSTP